MVRLMLVFGFAVTAALSAAGATDVVRPAGQRDGSHDMDFSFGTWRTDITVVKDPFSATSDTVHMVGTKVVRPVWNGKAALEEIEADGPSGHWQAANLMLFDPKANQWTQNYVDSETGRFEGAPGVGEYRDGKIEFYWQAPIGGRSLLLRGVWSDFTPNTHMYQVSRSADGGRTWHTSFTARLTRLK